MVLSISASPETVRTANYTRREDGRLSSKCKFIYFNKLMDNYKDISNVLVSDSNDLNEAVIE